MLLQRIQYFHAAADCGNFSAAAQRCNTSRASLSQQVRALEDELGTPLLRRRGRGLALTEAGELFYEKSKGLLAELDELVEDVKHLPRSSGGILRIGYLSCYGAPEFQHAVSTFARKHPELEVEILNGSQEELYTAIRTGRVHVVLNDQQELFGENYVNYQLVESRCYVELPRSHPLAGQDRLQAKQLRLGRCILVAGEAHRKAEQAYYREAMGFQGEFLFARNMQAARDMMASGQGFLPVEGIGEEEELSGAAARIPLYMDEKPVLRSYCASWRKDAPAQLAQEFSELGVIMTAFTLITGNLIFYMLDRILRRITVMTKWGRK
jgi:DNA-binding transcriptional LysR family regulator